MHSPWSAEPADTLSAAGTQALAQPHTRLIQALLYAGALVFALVWWVESQAGVLTPWDFWLLPVMGCGVFASALLLHWRPALQPWVMLGNVACLNLYLVATLHASLHFGTGALQWFQFSTVLYWVPLGYGLAFVCLGTRAALGVSAITFTALFGPLTWVAMAGRAPPWASSFGAFLAVIAMAHGMYVLLLLAVVRLRAGQARAEESARLLHLVATTDTLTGLPNRRALNAALQSGIASARQSGQPLAVALIDIDHFKAINDTHGHAAGDDVLRQIGQVMQAELRRTDGVGRWGGEEFLLCLPGTSISAAADLAERLRLAVQLHEFPHGQPVTVSIGLAQLLGEDDLEQLLQRTDRALYRAKAQGRNRTEIQTIGVA